MASVLYSSVVSVKPIFWTGTYDAVPDQLLARCPEAPWTLTRRRRFRLPPCTCPVIRRTALPGHVLAQRSQVFRFVFIASAPFRTNLLFRSKGRKGSPKPPPCLRITAHGRINSPQFTRIPIDTSIAFCNNNRTTNGSRALDEAEMLDQGSLCFTHSTSPARTNLHQPVSTTSHPALNIRY